MGRVTALSASRSHRSHRPHRTWRNRPLTCLAAVTLCLCAGCLNLRTQLEIPAPIDQSSSATQPNNEGDARLSGALDGPTLRLALRDLAVILDTLGRLEQVRPDLKSQMLRELADADAATAAAVVKRWRARLPELQEVAERSRLALLESRTPDRTSVEPTRETTPPKAATPAPEPPRESPVVAPARWQPGGTPRSSDSQTANSLADVDSSAELESFAHPCWDDLLDSLVGMTRDRADESGPDAARAQIQLALLELLRRSQESDSGLAMPDPQLWNHLDPAIQYCFGSRAAGNYSLQEVVRSLQVATELLRGPGRFQPRGLAFCSRIRGFGNIDRIDSNSFRPGQPVLLYSEVEHFLSEPELGGFRTRISSRVELLDAGGRVIWNQDFAAIDDTSGGPRRDFFLSYRFALPQTVAPGIYSIRLTLCDELANRSASAAIALSIH